jgi:ABC-2 type transport system permease protein
MTLAADRWPTFVEPKAGATRTRRHGVVIVWKLELSKLIRQLRVQAVAAICLAAPFLVVAAVKVQGSVPQDTLFGQWLHQSGFALPMVVVGFAGQWALPLLTSIVSGNIFAAEDHYGTWKMVVTRSRSRGDLFAGKVLAALTYTVVVLALLAASSLVAGLLLGTGPVVGLSGQLVPAGHAAGLSGQLVPAGHAAGLVVASWASQLPSVLGYCSLALLLSVATGNVVIGVGGPVLLGLVMQLTSLVSLPSTVQGALLSTPFGAWHGLWVDSPFYGPLRQGLITSAVWFVACATAAWMLFRRRTFGAA